MCKLACQKLTLLYANIYANAARKTDILGAVDLCRFFFISLLAFYARQGLCILTALIE